MLTTQLQATTLNKYGNPRSSSGLLHRGRACCLLYRHCIRLLGFKGHKNMNDKIKTLYIIGAALVLFWMGVVWGVIWFGGGL